MRPCRPRHDLPSFPTRRSSDLAQSLEVEGSGSSLLEEQDKCQGRGPQSARRELRTAPLAFVLLFQERSEEHTSELQSHHDLVCRLLLEKKKKKTTSYPSLTPQS